MNAVIDFSKRSVSDFKQISTRFDHEFGVMWSIMQPEPRPCFSMTCLGDLLQQHTYLQSSQGQVVVGGTMQQVNYLVLASSVEMVGTICTSRGR